MHRGLDGQGGSLGTKKQSRITGDPNCSFRQFPIARQILARMYRSRMAAKHSDDFVRANSGLGIQCRSVSSKR